jgi:hypothetical protein
MSEAASGQAPSYASLWREAAATGARVRDYGASAKGEPLRCLDVAGGGAGAVLVIAGLHAMEHVGPVTAIRLAARAAAQVASGGGPWARRRLVIAPIANPDGFVEVERARAAGGIAARRFRRKNARGVDLNRNFAEAWDGRHVLARALPGVFAAGGGPLSEPETAALDALASEIRPAAVVSLHAFGEWIYVPWASRGELPPDGEAMLAVGRAMAARQREPYRVRQLGARSRFFRPRGLELDHFYARHGAWSFLIEIGAGPRLGDPAGWADPYRWFTPRADLLERDVENVLPALDAVAEAELPARP